MSNLSRIDVDELTGVLYAKLPGTRMVVCEHAPHDDDIVLNLDADRNVIGVTVLSAVDADPEDWFSHPDRAVIPWSILASIDAWFRDRG